MLQADGSAFRSGNLLRRPTQRLDSELGIGYEVCDLIICDRGTATMAALGRHERLQIMLSGKELEALENWRFERRMPSRAAAVRELLRLGLAAEEGLVTRQVIKSRDFGVLDPDSEGSENGPD